MMETKKSRSERFVLLTQKERDVLHNNKDMSPKTRSKLVEKLNQKLPELFNDLELIFTSKKLENWRDIKKRQYFEDFSKLYHLFGKMVNQDYRIIFTDKIRKIRHNGIAKYYVEEWDFFQIRDNIEKKKHNQKTKKVKNEIYNLIESMYRLDFVLRGLKEKTKTREILKEAFIHNLIPRDSTKAEEIKEIWIKIPPPIKKKIALKIEKTKF